PPRRAGVHGPRLAGAVRAGIRLAQRPYVVEGERISAAGDDPAARGLRAGRGDGRGGRRTCRGGGGRRGPRADEGHPAAQRCVGARPDVTGYRLAQRRDGGGPGVLRAGYAHVVSDESVPWATGLTVSAFVAA